MKPAIAKLCLISTLGLGPAFLVSSLGSEALAAPKKGNSAGSSKAQPAKPAKKEGPSIVAVGSISGPMRFSVKQWVRGTLQKAPTEKFILLAEDKALASSDEKTLAAYAKKSKADAVLVGEVQKTPAGYSLSLTVHGPDGVEMDGVEFEGTSAAKLRTSVEAALLTALEGVLGKGAAAEIEQESGIAPAEVVLEEDESAEEEPAEEAPPVEESSEPEKAASNLPALKLQAGARVRSRSYSYVDPLDAFYSDLQNIEFQDTNGAGTFESGARYPLQDYSFVYPGVFIEGDFYPASFFTTGIPTYIGVTGYYQQDALASETAVGEDPISTTSASYFVGGKVRVPLGEHLASVFGGIGQHRYDIGTDVADFRNVGTTSEKRVSEVPVPNVGYSYLRVGAEGTVKLSAISITAGAAFRKVSEMGELQDDNWFPFAEATGFDAGLSGELPIGDGPLAVVAGLDFIRYAWKGNSAPDDVPTARVAGGGTDNYISGWAGLSVALSGTGSAGGQAASVTVAAGSEASGDDAGAEDDTSSDDESFGED